MREPVFNDEIHPEGFPDGWHVQDRLDEGVALLCRQISYPIPGNACICLRPKSISTRDWLPVARKIAEGLELVYYSRPTGGSDADA